jgi:alpha-ketoglutarate-dependent taurine dioxygenase
MAVLEASDIAPEFGSEVSGLVPRVPLDSETCKQLRTLFDERSLLVFRDLDADIAFQTYLSNLLIGNDASVPDDLPIRKDFYVSNEKPNSAAPFGRLMYHSDSQRAKDWCYGLSLYAEKVEQPAVPTMFVSSVVGWDTLPEELRVRADNVILWSGTTSHSSMRVPTSRAKARRARCARQSLHRQSRMPLPR